MIEDETKCQVQQNERGKLGPLELEVGKNQVGNFGGDKNSNWKFKRRQKIEFEILASAKNRIGNFRSNKKSNLEF